MGGKKYRVFWGKKLRFGAPGKAKPAWLGAAGEQKTHPFHAQNQKSPILMLWRSAEKNQNGVFWKSKNPNFCIAEKQIKTPDPIWGKSGVRRWLFEGHCWGFSGVDYPVRVSSPEWIICWGCPRWTPWCGSSPPASPHARFYPHADPAAVSAPGSPPPRVRFFPPTKGGCMVVFSFIKLFVSQPMSFLTFPFPFFPRPAGGGCE